MSGGGQRPVVHDDNTYLNNKKQLERMQAMLNQANAINEEGKRNFEQMENELKRKIQQGAEAQRQLEALRNQRRIGYHGAVSDNQGLSFPLPGANTSPAPSARIEEVRSHDHRQSTSHHSNYPENYYHQPYQQPQSNNYMTQNAQQQQHAGPSNQHHAFSGQANHSYGAQNGSAAPFSSRTQPFYQHTTAPVPQPTVSQRAPPLPPFPAEPNQPQTRSSPFTMPTNATSISQSQNLPTQTSTRASAQATQTQASVVPAQNQSVFDWPSTSTARPASRPAASAQASKQAPPVSFLKKNQISTSQTASRPSPPVVVQLQPHIHQTAPQPSQPVSTSVSNKPSTTPSYGISPFAHNPAANTRAIPNAVAGPSTGQQPIAPRPVVQQPTPLTTMPAKPKTPITQSVPPAAPPTPGSPSGNAFMRFKRLIDAWQRASPPMSCMDIPTAQIRVKKFPTGEIWFFCPDPKTYEQMRISCEVAFRRVNPRGTISIYVNKAGVTELLPLPLTDKQQETCAPFKGAVVAGAPEAKFPDPPAPDAVQVPSTLGVKRPFPGSDGPAVRTPKQADKRFLAHDVLRALGKSPADDVYVQYTKKRAIEEQESHPIVPQRVSSNEPSAKSTPAPSSHEDSSAAESRIPSPLPAMPVPAPISPRVIALPVQPQPKPQPPQQPPRVPLFLPAESSTPSSLQTFAPHRSSSEQRCYVLIPPPPPHVARDVERLRELHRRAASADNLSGDVQDVEAETVEQEEEEEEEEEEVDIKELKRRRMLGMYPTTQNEQEEAAMLMTCTRLREVPCKWLVCGSVLNSLENLILHLHELHAQEDEDTATCMWDMCGEKFESSIQLALHAETHILGSIPCAYQDCAEVFSSPSELTAHNNLGHQSRNKAGTAEFVPPLLLPSTRPSAPKAETLPLPVVPQFAPGWEIQSPELRMPYVSEERHKTLGPWVLRNIVAPIGNIRSRRYNAAVPLKMDQPDYEFVETSSKHYSSWPSRPARVRDMADLTSKYVTEFIANGELVLWPPEDGIEHSFGAESDAVSTDELDMLKEEPVDDRHIDEIVAGDRNALEEGSTSSTVVEDVPVLQSGKDMDGIGRSSPVPLASPGVELVLTTAPAAAILEEQDAQSTFSGEHASASTDILNVLPSFEHNVLPLTSVPLAEDDEIPQWTTLDNQNSPLVQTQNLTDDAVHSGENPDEEMLVENMLHDYTYLHSSDLLQNVV
ncbi:hypothetical protein R3P38DRAFT_691380 [Favolaschia claudopus]|uniref:C2H2-type domain-containing protein n=1 Tax=Favolaschia claudopus TaxID=2862362 RepID=A0AAW0EFS5_9AGAR